MFSGLGDIFSNTPAYPQTAPTMFTYSCSLILPIYQVKVVNDTQCMRKSIGSCRQDIQLGGGIEKTSVAGPLMAIPSLQTIEIII